MGTKRYRIEIDEYDQNILASALYALRKEWSKEDKAVERIDDLILKIACPEKRKAGRNERE